MAEIEAKTLKWRRKLPLLLLVPYLVGIIWHALHPMVSVFTGHMQPRKWYIDENSLEPSYFKMNLQFEPLNAKGWQRRSLCASVPRNSKIRCAQHPDSLEVLKVTPTIGAIRPVAEAIVLVVPWNTPQVSDSFQVSIVHLIHLLAEANWLSKTVLIVTGSDSSTDLSSTVDRFLDVYLGPADGLSFRSPLPKEFNGLILRNLLVFNAQRNSAAVSPLHEVRILPQGRRGVLPNMDLTFLSMFVYSRSFYIRTRKAVVTMHPYRDQARQWQETIQPNIPKGLHEWFSKFLELLAFEFSLMRGPFPPHATALDRGIDALTIEAWITPNDVPGQVTADCVQRLEYVLRSLSNLHERLHHSTSLYLLVSPERFVKHEEYLVPNLLLLIPLVVRAITLILVDIPAFHWPTVKTTILVTLVSTAALHGVVSNIDQEITTFALLLVYTAMALLLHFGLRPLSRQTIQFVACMAALLVHIPIAFGHVSLAFPSALLWTPLIAFPSLASREGNEKRTVKFTKFFIYAFSVTAVVMTLPSILLVPRLFPDYTIYVRYGYIPLHLLFAILYLS